MFVSYSRKAYTRWTVAIFIRRQDRSADMSVYTKVSGLSP